MTNRKNKLLKCKLCKKEIKTKRETVVNFLFTAHKKCDEEVDMRIKNNKRVFCNKGLNNDGVCDCRGRRYVSYGK